LASLCFIPSVSGPLEIALLNQTPDGKHEIISHQIDTNSSNQDLLQPNGSLTKIVDEGAEITKIIPVPGKNGILTCSATELRFYAITSANSPKSPQKSPHKRRSTSTVDSSQPTVTLPWTFSEVTA